MAKYIILSPNSSRGNKCHRRIKVICKRQTDSPHPMKSKGFQKKRDSRSNISFHIIKGSSHLGADKNSLNLPIPKRQFHLQIAQQVFRQNAVWTMLRKILESEECESLCVFCSKYYQKAQIYYPVLVENKLTNFQQFP